MKILFFLKLFGISNGSYRKILLGFFENPFKTLTEGRTKIEGLGYYSKH